MSCAGSWHPARVVVALVATLATLCGTVAQATATTSSKRKNQAATAMVAAEMSSASSSGVSSVTLPGSFNLQQVFVSGDELSLTGAQDSVGGWPVACVQMPVSPTSLKLSRVAKLGCDDPKLEGASVAPYVSAPRIDYSEVRIARIVPSTGAVELGPVLATYQDSSGTHLEWAYAPGSLWLYEMGTARGPMVFRVSTVTGKLLQETTVPLLVRPLITVDENGLYIAAAGSFGGIGDAVIYRVGVGARAARNR